jgi:hypothetical protein
MKCSNCKSNLLNIETDETEVAISLLGSNKIYEGKILRNLSISKNGCLNFSFCPRCGKMSGKFPIDLNENIPWSEVDQYLDDVCVDAD